MAAGKVAGHAQLQIGALVREGGREDFARLDVHADAVNDGPVDVTAQDGVELADARLRQVDFERVLVEGLCGEKNGIYLNKKNQIVRPWLI